MLTIVLLPGMDGTGSLFEPFINALGSEVTVQVISYPTTGALGYSELEEQVRRLLPVNGRFVILGESFSGPIAVSLAASHPKGLVGLILSSTFIRNPRPVFGPLRHFVNVLPVKLAPMTILSAFLLGRFATPQLRSALATAMSQISSEALRSRFHSVLSVNVSAKLKTVEIPLLYLLATQDQVVPVSAWWQIKKDLPAAQVVSIDAPHFLLQVAPDEAAQVVKKFMHALQNDR